MKNIILLAVLLSFGISEAKTSFADTTMNNPTTGTAIGLFSNHAWYKERKDSAWKQIGKQSDSAGVAGVADSAKVANDGTYHIKTFAELLSFKTTMGSSKADWKLDLPITPTENCTLLDNLNLADVLSTGYIMPSAYNLHIMKQSTDPIFQWVDTASNVTYGAGAVSHVRPEWWGASTSQPNNTMANQLALSAGGTVVFSKGKFITSQLLLMSNSKIILAPACTLMQINSDTLTAVTDLIRIDNKHNVEIDGSGSAVIMGIRVNKSQGRMGIRIDGADSAGYAENIRIHDLRIENFDGDGIYINGSRNNEESYPKNVTIENVVARNNLRTGFVILSGNGVTFRNCTAIKSQCPNDTLIGGTGEPMPQAGFNFEPDIGSIKNIIVENCFADSNNGNGFEINMGNYIDADKVGRKVDVTYNNCYSRYNDGAGYKCQSMVAQYNYLKIGNCFAVGNKLNGIRISNPSVYGLTTIDGLQLLNNSTEKNDTAWGFPVINADNPAIRDTGAKADFLLFTNETGAFDISNNGKGFKSGTVKVKNLQIFNDSVDRVPVYVTSFEGVSGSGRPPIRGVTIDNFWIKTIANRFPKLINDDYAQDVKFTNMFTWDTLLCNYTEAHQGYISSGAIVNDSFQGFWLQNVADTTITLTLPGCQADSGKQQRFSFECKNAAGLKVLAVSDDRIEDQNQRLLSVVSYDVGSRLKIEKSNGNSWRAVEKTGVWFYNDIVTLGDSNYTIQQSDSRRVLSNANWSAQRILTLPTITTKNLGLEIELLNRNSDYPMMIDVPSTDIIMGLANALGDSIQAIAQGATLRLKASTEGGGSVWQVISYFGGWRDIKGTAPYNYSQKSWLDASKTGTAPDTTVINSTGISTYGIAGLTIGSTGTKIVNWHYRDSTFVLMTSATDSICLRRVLP